MPLVVPNWLADHVELAPDADVHNISAALVKVGIEEEEVHGAAVTGPLVVGKVLAKNPEPQKNGKVINWCLVDVGPEHNTNEINGVTAQQLKEANAPATGARGIVCGAHNFEVGDYVVVSLPGTVLPGPFPIAARKTYGHVSDGMICSTAELGLPDDGADGIIVLNPEDYPVILQQGADATQSAEPQKGTSLTPGQNAIELLGLGDETLEVNVTPDRGYQFSYRGMAREYGLATGAKFTDPVIALAAQVPPPTSDAFPVEIDDEAPIRGAIGCDRFATRIVNNINPKAPTPKWIQQRLEQSGMRSISLPVDITNYVMLDLGQPVHAYDLDKIVDPVVVRRAIPGERLTTLDGIERNLDAEDLLITDSAAPSAQEAEGQFGASAGSPGARVLGLAGVMGGASTEISDTTKNVLVECAHFDPVTVARTARRHKLPTEAAKRFERGVDPALPPVAAQMVVDLLVKYAGGTASAEVGDEDAITAPQPIILRLSLPQQIVGVEYSPETIVNVLESIGCTVEIETNPCHSAASLAEAQSAEPQKHRECCAIVVTPPTWRPDLTEPVDLVEEIVRIDGYDKVPSTLPAAPGGRGLTSDQRLRRSIARTLAEAGLVEVLTYPFVGPKDYEAIRSTSSPCAEPQGSDAAPAANISTQQAGPRLANPLSADRPELRSNLLITLLDAARRNYQRGLTDFGLFEIGLVTQPLRPVPASASVEPVETKGANLVPAVGARPDSETLTAIHASLPEQPRQVAAVLVGDSEPSGWWGNGRKADWSDALGLAQKVAARAGITLEALSQAPTGPTWHPGRSAILTAKGQSDLVVGVAGELHPKVATNFGLPARPVAFELNLAKLSQARNGETVKATPVSAYPVAKEDFAFVVPQGTSAQVLERAIASAGGDLLESVALFDIFTGPQIGEGNKSLAYTVRLRGSDRTLTDDDVKGTRDLIIAAAAAIGAELRA